VSEDQRPERDIVVSADQIAQAPDAVRQWLHGLHGDDGSAGFLAADDDAATTADGLAICSAFEVKTLLHMLSDDFLGCQVLFGLGCEYDNPANGVQRGHAIQLTDFLHHTDAKNVFEVLQSLDTINGALQSLRRDPYATIYRPDGMGGFRVEASTQRVIYQLWNRLRRLTQPRRGTVVRVGFEARRGPVEAA